MKERVTWPGTKHAVSHASTRLPCSEELQALYDFVYWPEAFHVSVEVHAAEPLYDLVPGDIRLLRIRGRSFEECSIVQPREVGLAPNPEFPVWMVKRPTLSQHLEILGERFGSNPDVVECSWKQGDILIR